MPVVEILNVLDIENQDRMVCSMESAHGGRRAGAGRPKGSGGPSELVRRNRVTVLLTDEEMELLRRHSRQLDLPVGTTAYHLLTNTLAQRVRRRE